MGTPRAVSKPNGAVVWSWISDAFGETVPNEDPDGDGEIFTLNLRHPGQYRDSETGFYQNWHRYYDPRSGRYITSDPIGLEGGLNTFSYALGNPIQLFDSRGLEIEGYFMGVNLHNVDINSVDVRGPRSSERSPEGEFPTYGVADINATATYGLRIKCVEYDSDCGQRKIVRTWYPRNGGSITFDSSIPLKDYGLGEIPMIGSLRRLFALKVALRADAAATAITEINRAIREQGGGDAVAQAICLATANVPAI